jgi:hypothetical protein
MTHCLVHALRATSHVGALWLLLVITEDRSSSSDFTRRVIVYLVYKLAKSLYLTGKVICNKD